MAPRIRSENMPTAAWETSGPLRELSLRPGLTRAGAQGQCKIPAVPTTPVRFHTPAKPRSLCQAVEKLYIFYSATPLIVIGTVDFLIVFRLAHNLRSTSWRDQERPSRAHNRRNKRDEIR